MNNGEEWEQFDRADFEATERDLPTARRKVAPLFGQTLDASVESEVAECRALLGEIAHRAVMETAKKEGRTSLLDERLEYEGYGDCLSICRVRAYDPNPLGQTAKRPLIVVFTEQDDNPGTSVTNCIAHLANRIFERLGKPEPAPVFVEHYPNRLNDFENRPQFDRTERLSGAESFAIVGFNRSATGVFQSPNWQHTTRQTVEVIVGQSVL